MHPLQPLSELSEDERIVTPRYARHALTGAVPRFELAGAGIDPDLAYQLIHDELLLDGSARLNLATFVTTWMDPQAQRLMSETFDKNMVDKDEYPQTAEIEQRCVNIISRLFHAPDGAVGVSTIGSSEAVMLAGLALKWRWRERMRAAGKPTDKPNMIMGSNVQVVWEKFCRYWDVEPRYLNMEPGRYTITPEQVLEAVDENTIAVMAILGTTYTGEFEPIKAIHDALEAHNKKSGYETPMHIDAASGGFVAPFLHPDVEWDFRLPLVKSINASGHKYGLVYPGVGWVAWRNTEDLPEDLVFRVNYLGGDMPTFTLNFSRPGNQVIAQYYNFLRLGRAGYTQIMKSLRDTAMFVSRSIEAMGPFELLSDGSAIPVFAFRVKPEHEHELSVFDISDKLRERGWQVPAYTMPPGAEEIAVLRIVVRDGMSMDMARMLLDDITHATESLRQAASPSTGSHRSGFKH